jgi:hypothetical protein
LFHHKVQHSAAERFWDGFRSGVAIIEAVGLADLEVAWKSGTPGVTGISPSLIALASL